MTTNWCTVCFYFPISPIKYQYRDVASNITWYIWYEHAFQTSLYVLNYFSEASRVNSLSRKIGTTSPLVISAIAIDVPATQELQSEYLKTGDRFSELIFTGEYQNSCTRQNEYRVMSDRCSRVILLMNISVVPNCVWRDNWRRCLPSNIVSYLGAFMEW